MNLTAALFSGKGARCIFTVTALDYSWKQENCINDQKKSISSPVSFHPSSQLYSGKGMARVNVLFPEFSVWASDDKEFRGFLYWRLYPVYMFFSIRIFLFKVYHLIFLSHGFLQLCLEGSLPMKSKFISWSKRSSECLQTAGVCSVDEHRQQENYAVNAQKVVLFKTPSKRP